MIETQAHPLKQQYMRPNGLCYWRLGRVSATADAHGLSFDRVGIVEDSP